MSRVDRRSLCVYLLSATVVPALLPTDIRAATAEAFDLVVYGATPSGVATAVAAARNGLHVALVHPDNNIGGMVAGGLSSTDHGNEAVIGGIAREFFERVGAHYGESIEWNFEPHVASDVFHELLDESHVRVFLNSPILENRGVLKSGARITSITVRDGRVFRAPVFADCTYDGILLGLAGVSYTWGRESREEYGERLAGVRGWQRPDHQFTVRVSPYAANGSLLPLVQPGPRGKIGSGDKKVEAYGFRLCITQNPKNRLPFPKPPNYDPARYELLSRFVAALTKAKGRPPVIREMMILSTLKNGKYDANSLGAISTDDMGASWGYPTADARQRAAIWQEHYEYDAGFLYFLSHDKSIPPPLRSEVASYGLAKDEFTDGHGWPWQLYIRESRRMLGEYVMKQKDVQVEVSKPDAIGMGSYQIDSHGVERIPTADGAVENEGEMYVSTTPYQIPYRILVPKKAEASNLLVTVCVSASHVGYSSLRLEPQYMIMGQAAGVAAAVAVRNAQPVSEIPIGELQRRLKKGRVVLSLPS